MNIYRSIQFEEDAPRYSEELLPPPYSINVAHPSTNERPPPPSIWHRASPATNADRDAAQRARTWTTANPLVPPRSFTRKQCQKVDSGLITLIKPPDFVGDVIKNSTSPGSWSIRTRTNCKDACLLSELPLHSGNNRGFSFSSPAPRYCYFEIRIHRIDSDSGIGIGFAAAPYPAWRLPGWERASIGIHSDDGRRYVNDSAGGRDFTQPFRPVESYGIGMKFAAPRTSTGRANSSPCANVQVFFTRNGEMGGTWNLHEEVDSEMEQPGGVDGLEGDRDLYAAIGVFGACSFTVIFGKNNWTYRPSV